MSIPSFGPSQRLEISRKYLNYNETCTKLNDHQLYGSINPKNNVAEEGQVVLLWSEVTDCHGGTQRRTEVIPDAAGYPIDNNIPESLKESYLEQEILKYNIGVNQLERSVGKSHSSSGFGWDISFTPGHPVVIKHTGCEPIYRFDMIGIRFPNKEDVESQQSIWGGSNNAGNCISKFATYPIRENYNMVKHFRFIRSIQNLKQNMERGKINSNSSLQYLQIPAIMKLIYELYKYIKNEDLVDHFEEAITDINNMTFSTSSYDKLLSESGLNVLNGISKAACEYVETLNPPFILAQCIDFRCTQSQSKSQAECGDSMKCVLL